MKKLILLCTACLCSMFMSAQVRQMVGEWKTIDENSGEVKSIVEIYEGSDHLYYGKIKQLIGQPADVVCVPCEGEEHNKPIVGLIIIRGMQVDGNNLVNGKVLDPENGKWYYCSKISLNNGDLVLRGSLDKKGWFGRSQTWKRK